MMTVTIMKKTNLKTRVGIFKNMGGNIPGGNFPGGSFSDTGLCIAEHAWKTTQMESYFNKNGKILVLIKFRPVMLQNKIRICLLFKGFL